MRLGVPFRAADLVLPIESPLVDQLLAAAELLAATDPRGRAGEPAVVSVGRLPERRSVAAIVPADDDTREPEDAATSRRAIAAELQGWAAGARDLHGLRTSIGRTRELLNELRRDDAPLTLATAHGTKGLEFDHVAVIGLDEGRFPSARSIADAVEPDRALEEERRLAYVAWTRARRSLTLVYDPGSPSPFLLEAFDLGELGLGRAPRPRLPSAP
jgi:superfamily I DNA/RNA helicase